MLNKKLAFVSTLLLLVGVLIAACGPGGGSTGGGTGTGGGGTGGGGGASAVTFNTTGTEFKFDPNTLTAKAGSKIDVSLKNTGTIEHTFTLKEANFEIKAQPGQTATGSFTAPAAGTYQFFCSVAGHKEAGMVGTLTVQ